MPQQVYPYENPNDDLRRKVDVNEYETIKGKYNGGQSLRSLGREYNVDKGTVKAIVNPDWYKAKQEKRYEQKPWRNYYHKDIHKEYMRKHRGRKRELGLLSGLN